MLCWAITGDAQTGYRGQYGGGGATQYQVGWDGNGWPSVTGGYYLHIVGNDGSPNFSWCANVTDTIYGPGNLSDNISRNAGTDLNADGVFDIHYE
jgi:hypothetical protein